MNAQAQEALSLANERRLGMARWRRETAALSRKEGVERLAEILEADEIPAHVGAITIDRFLSSVSRVGADRVARFVRAAGIGRYSGREKARKEVRLRVRELTRREKDALAYALRHWGNQ